VAIEFMRPRKASHEGLFCEDPFREESFPRRSSQRLGRGRLLMFSHARV
jgi:hypothetical protein